MAAEAKPAKKYFAHPVVEDRYGVIAPWYRGQNGQCDFRVRIAAETLKRYPWTEPGKAVMPAPAFRLQRHLEHQARRNDQRQPELDRLGQRRRRPAIVRPAVRA